MSLFCSALQQLEDGNDVQVVYTLDVDEVIRTMQACFSFTYDCDFDYKNNRCKELKAETANNRCVNDGEEGKEYSYCSVSQDDRSRCLCMLAAVVMGHTVSPGVQRQVLDACRDQSTSQYTVVPCCCKPTEVLSCLVLPPGVP